jgi:transposase-like protein
MNPHERWCHNRRCRAYGRPGEGHIVIHSKKERRYQCKRCRRTFSETTDTTASKEPRTVTLLPINRILRSSFYAGSRAHCHALQCLNWHGALGTGVIWSIKVS